MKKALIVTLPTIALLLLVMAGCNKTKKVSDERPLNISVFLDMSDRITREMTPSQQDKDIAIVAYIADIIKNNTLGKSILKSKNAMKVFFYPTPNLDIVSQLADSMTFEVADYNGVEKRKQVEGLKEKIKKSLKQIYKQTLSEQKFIGCDIWDFFSCGKVDTQCIRKGNRNIIFIITDGYLYHINNKVRDGDSYSYILPEMLQNPNASLIAKRKGLEDLEVCVLEVNPYDIQHRDRMFSIIRKWFTDMGVKPENIEIAETDLPDKTRRVIDTFMKKEGE